MFFAYIKNGSLVSSTIRLHFKHRNPYALMSFFLERDSYGLPTKRTPLRWRSPLRPRILTKPEGNKGLLTGMFARDRLPTRLACEGAIAA